MNEKTCPHCGTPLAPAAPDALCLQCLMGTAVAALARSGDTIHYFGDYELIQEIARGGMGIVYAARQKSLNRVVALKRILHGTLADAEQVRRFHAEAEAAARLHHPNIVGLYEIGEHEGQHYFSMEYIEGQDLAELLRDGPLAARRAAELLKTISIAVAHAHQQGVLHRDLKPSNVLVDEHDQPHVTDFGLAKLLTGDADLTQSGQVLGTPNYMSPEQAAGDRAALGPATDIYSLGALLYHLLTGRPPFVAATPAETLRLAEEVEPAAPRTLEASVPADLETICLKCLAKKPSHRYATAQELAADLGRFLRGEPIHARPVTRVERAWRWCHREPALAGAIGAVALLLVALAVGSSVTAWRINLTRENEMRHRQRAELLAREEQARTRQAEQHAAAAWQTIGMELAEAAFSKGTNTEGVAALAAMLRANPSNRVAAERLLSALSVHAWPLLERRGFADTGRVMEATFSADGTLLATGTDAGAVRVWNTLTGEPVTPALSLTGSVKRIRFGAQGRYFAAISDRAMRAWHTASGAPVTPVLPTTGGKEALTVSSREHYFSTCESNLVRVFNLTNGTELYRLPHEGAVQLLMFTPAGQLATFERNLVRLWSMDSGQLLAGPWSYNGPVRAAMFSPDGTRLLMSLGWTLMIVSTTNGAVLTRLPAPAEMYVYTHYAPDSARVLTVGDGGPARLWSAADGRPLGTPMYHADRVWAARFSGHGPRLITWGKDWTVRVWTADTTERLAEPVRSLTKIINAEISPDGRRVVVVSAEEEAFHLWRLPARAPLAVVLSNSLSSRLTGPEAWAGRHTRDGKRTLTAPGLNSAQVADSGTGLHPTTPMVHKGPILDAAFSPDERMVVTASADHTARLWDARSGLPAGFSFRHAGAVNSAVLSEDGLRLLTASDDGTARLWDVLSGWAVSQPLPDPPGIRHARFGADLHQVLLDGRDSLVRAVAVPHVTGSVPAWLPDLAEAVVQKALTATNTFQRVPPEKILEVEQRIAQTGGDDFYARWAKWFFALPGATNAFPVAP